MNLARYIVRWIYFCFILLVLTTKLHMLCMYTQNIYIYCVFFITYRIGEWHQKSPFLITKTLHQYQRLDTEKHRQKLTEKNVYGVFTSSLRRIKIKKHQWYNYDKKGKGKVREKLRRYYKKQWMYKIWSNVPIYHYNSTTNGHDVVYVSLDLQTNKCPKSTVDNPLAHHLPSPIPAIDSGFLRQDMVVTHIECGFSSGTPI